MGSHLDASILNAECKPSDLSQIFLNVSKIEII